MTLQLAHIRRHPIKSIGGEGLECTGLTAARRMPGDREWAVLTETGERHTKASETAGEPDRWLPKSCFLRGVVAPSLQAVSGGWSNDQIRLHHPEQGELLIHPETESAKLIEWLAPLWPVNAPPPTRLVRGAGIWTDVKWPWISILSLSSLADLEARAGQKFGINRWRGNLWLDGAAPFAERGLIGQVIRIGTVELRITDEIGRCDATSANTETGDCDTDMPDTLNRHYGHSNFGVYAEVVTNGDVSLGDEVSI